MERLQWESLDNMALGAAHRNPSGLHGGSPQRYNAVPTDPGGALCLINSKS
jgi:hypothetical protein